jgi:hypothetical protein
LKTKLKQWAFLKRCPLEDSQALAVVRKPRKDAGKLSNQPMTYGRLNTSDDCRSHNKTKKTSEEELLSSGRGIKVASHVGVSVVDETALESVN